MALIETVSKRTFVEDVEHTPLCPKKQFSPLPPSVASVPPAASTSSDERRAATSFSSSSGRSTFFKMFKSLFSICQSNQQELTVSHERQEVLLENQWNIRQKMQMERHFVEFCPVEALSQLQDPFASLTAVEMVFLCMDTPGTSTSNKNSSGLIF
jgi:hypothetical protein